MMNKVKMRRLDALGGGIDAGIAVSGARVMIAYIIEEIKGNDGNVLPCTGDNIEGVIAWLGDLPRGDYSLIEEALGIIVAKENEMGKSGGVR